MAKVGFSSTTINPEIGVFMSGFYPVRAYQRKHSDLWLRAVVLKEEFITLFLQFDTIAVDNYFYNEISKRLEKFAIPKERIIVSASHTHSAPVGLINTREGIFKGAEGMLGDYNPAFVAEMLDKVETTVAKALANLKEVKGVTFGKSEITGIGKERHDPALPGDNRLVSWCYETMDGEKVLFYNFACHPTILDGNSDYLSSDFPGAVAKLLRNEFREVVFINGSCGDISTRFTRSGESIEQIDKFAHRLADQIKIDLASGKTEPEVKIKLTQKQYPLKIKEFDSEEVALATLQQYEKEAEAAKDLPASDRRVIESFMEGARTNLSFVQNFKGITEVILDVTFLKINKEIFVTIPAELFSSLSNEMRAEKGIIFLGYTNGYCLYVADRAAYEKGYYEAMSSIYEQGQGEGLIEAIDRGLTIWLTEV